MKLIKLIKVNFKNALGVVESFSFAQFEEINSKRIKYIVSKTIPSKIFTSVIYEGYDKEIANNMYRSVIKNAKKEDKRFFKVQVL